MTAETSGVRAGLITVSVMLATITGAGVPALKMRVSRACERLRDLLKDVR